VNPHGLSGISGGTIQKWYRRARAVLAHRLGRGTVFGARRYRGSRVENRLEGNALFMSATVNF